MLKILIFLFFLVAYVGWAIACAKSLKMVQNDMLAGKSFWTTELVLLESLAGFFGFIYLLSGLWSFKLVLLIFVASHLGSLIAWLLSAILGAKTEQAGIRTLWAGKEIDIKYPIPMAILALVSGVMSLSYPIVAGVHFFRHPWGSSVLELLLVKYSLLLLSLSGYLLIVIVTGLMLASENLDEDTRQRIFINQLGGLIPAAIYVALAFWAFGFGGTPLSIGVLGIPDHTLSWQTLAMLLIFFAVTVLIPYVIGTQRARRATADRLQKVRDSVADLTSILEAPTGSLYVAKLTELRDGMVATLTQFINSDALLSYVQKDKVQPQTTAPADRPILDAIDKTRTLDARFRFINDLSKLKVDVDGIIADLQTRPAATIEDAAEHWSKQFEIRKAELDKTIDAAASKKPLITAGAGSMVILVVSGMLGEVTKIAWQWIAHVPAK